jgi:hypothetical protein
VARSLGIEVTDEESLMKSLIKEEQ